MRTIGIDAGTTRFKGVLCENGKILRRAEVAVAYSLNAERVEIDPEEHWRQFAGLLRELSENTAVDAVAVAAASGNSLLLDFAGQPLTPIISWLDQRGEHEELPALAGLEAETMRRITGWPCIRIFPPAHLAWWHKHTPELLRQAQVSQSHSFLLYRLTGWQALDDSSATPLLLVDQTTRNYDPGLLARFGLRRSQLPELLRSGDLIGTVTPEAAQATGLTTATRVAAGSFDHPAGARSCGIVNEGQLLLSCGTSWVGFFPCASRERILEAKLLCDPFTSADNGLWGAIFSIPGIGRIIDRYVTEYVAQGSDQPHRRFDELAASVPDAGGVRIDLTGPYRKPEAPEARVARALMEEAARLLALEMRRLTQYGMAFREAVMIGGPTKSPVWPGIVAEHTGLKLTTADSYAGAEGAAMLAKK